MTKPKKLAADDSKGGRPPGSPNRDYELVAAEPTRCPKCGSTERTPYRNPTEQAYAGVDQGKPYTHIVRRYTSCKACGQFRIDRSHENRQGAALHPVPPAGSDE